MFGANVFKNPARDIHKILIFSYLVFQLLKTEYKERMLMLSISKPFCTFSFPDVAVVLCFPGLQSVRELGESTLVVNHLKIPRKQKRDKGL